MKKMYFGQQVSEHGAERGFVDYRTLSNVVGDMILCNDMELRYGSSLELENGKTTIYYDSEGNEVDSDSDNIENERTVDIFQWYIISNSGAEFLESHTDEIVFYDTELNVSVWGITHFGTSWDYVLTDIEL